MEVCLLIFIFWLGTIFGSFYNVVGYRIPNNESIVFPSSHCPNCNHKLKFYELIPIFSYIFQKGKCTKCHKKISLFYPFFEFLTGLLFVLSYLSFGLTPNFIICITFISMLIIITVSDYNYMIVPDSILVLFAILLVIEIFIIYGFNYTIISILNGIASFIAMFLLKKFGDFIFKKESMGGGDIKLMFIFGLVLTFPVAVLSIFVGSLIGLPISIILLKKGSDHIIPFVPFLSAGAVILMLLQINLDKIINYLNY